MIRGDRVLFKDVCVVAPMRSTVTLRGSNGTGKTTLLRILAGLTRPETGAVTRNAPHHWIAHREGLKPHETPRQHLALWARAWGSEADIESILQTMSLARPADVPARHLSAGQRRRTALARLLLDKRPIWLLDEPFTALDADGRALVLSLIEDHCRQDGCVIAAIHGDAGFEATAEVVL
ncbi:MAG: heme ABC exporter ATP-binding protein CcmA [Hyphomonas sp.]|nr:heme ABC exporter ATP-binding protein CcmA [Hyphomonas sp.]